ncbi:cytochrome c-type biogenesis protein CcmH [Colwellia sp. BRX8-3]|nr:MULTISPECIES: cytochrome c-type biogenesis protein [unclassified Colwellia]MBA6362197.1 cytochrome c-type biogenesis protein CcmH [Colwellia sp. BRX8-8]MBA6351322.1 cytochrome c-type biogenesis protein CcmH [Colwellia sp. BRX9-1]MBA6357851.1 cytochrome c-type biogenesis protein CcmH [Colwellia sp. BRX8-3]MBA6361637.1 cytochrome c-type biogenesis protein CcmH [Colwellia sp. BRX8-6]MBA6366657.1 cytochrome c-type biogenesis protein CcmH [Colwellia sp. BRX8-5]
MFNKLLVAVFLTTVTLLSSFVLASPVDTYVFKDKVTEIRFNALNKELRCPKCQNQNLADSNSPIAADLRREVYDMLQQGKADMEIVDFMVSRYGEFVLYRPRVSSLTYLLWYGPAGLLFIGVIVVVIILRRKPVKNAQQPLSNDQKNKLDQILKHK